MVEGTADVEVDKLPLRPLSLAPKWDREEAEEAVEVGEDAAEAAEDAAVKVEGLSAEDRKTVGDAVVEGNADVEVDKTPLRPLSLAPKSDREAADEAAEGAWFSLFDPGDSGSSCSE